MPDATRSQPPKLLDEVRKCCLVREGRCRKIGQKTIGHLAVHLMLYSMRSLRSFASFKRDGKGEKYG
jgi:hypothetical protein